MNVDETILDNLPEYSPTSVRTFTQTFEATTLSNGTTPQKTYTVAKSPYERLRSVTAIIDGVEQSLSIGTDVVESDSVGEKYRSFTFTNSIPDTGTEFTVEYNAIPIIVRYVETFDNDLSVPESKQNEIIATRGFENASGQRLDLYGSLFGDLGLRRRLSDEKYRSYLLAVVRAFNARGTIEDIRFVASSSLSVDEDVINVIEDTERVGFKVEIDEDDVDAIYFEAVNNLLRQTAPSGVELLRPIVFQTSNGELSVTATESEIVSRKSGLGYSTIGDTEIGTDSRFAGANGIVTITASESSVVSRKSGLGSGTLNDETVE